MCRTLSSMPFMTKFALFGIGIPFLVYTSCYVFSRMGAPLTFGKHLDSQSIKFIAVVVSSSLQIIFATASLEVRRIYFRVAMGKVNVKSMLIVVPSGIVFIASMLYSWNKFDRFGSAYVDSVSGIFNGVMYQIGWFIFPYGIVAVLYAAVFRFSISNRRHQAAKLRGDHGRGK